MSNQRSKVNSLPYKVERIKSRVESMKMRMMSGGIILALSFCTVFATGYRACAQKTDTADKVKITLIHSDNLVYNKTDSGAFNKFIGGVILQQGTDTLYCDSAYQNSTTKDFEAFSDVRIAQRDGTQGTSDYLKYTANKKLAYMRGNVSLTDGKNNLKCTELTYDLGTKTAVYDKGGNLHNDSTTVTSTSGIYDVKGKEAHFKGNVNIDDPQYKIKSEDVVYNTETKVTQFYAQSTVTRDSGRGVLQTRNGTYDGKNGIAHFVGHSSIWNDGQYIEGDTLNYNKITGYGLANGNVISIDTVHHSTMYCGHAEYFQKKRILWATVKPVLEQVNGKDTIYMRADTFYSAPMVKAAPKAESKKQKDAAKRKQATGKLNDSLKTNNYDQYITPMAAGDTTDVLSGILFPGINSDTVWAIPTVATQKKSLPPGRKGKKGKGTDSLAAVDTSYGDTTAPLYFIGYHHVLIFSDSLQGRCDSISYTRSDSIIRMIYAPIAWAHNSQVTGDTILMQLDSSHIKKMYVPDKAFVASQSGPPGAQLFNQLQGKTLTAYFKDNTITSMLIFPDAECIYYPKDEQNAYLGVDQGSSVRMRVFFDDEQIKTIKFEEEPHHTMTPMDKADIPNTRLSRFKWLIDERPKSKEELFR